MYIIIVYLGSLIDYCLLKAMKLVLGHLIILSLHHIYMMNAGLGLNEQC